MSYALRDLPLPVKVVASVFLMAVGAGYLSAMVQLHMQDAKSGNPMPTVADVIRKYTGKVKYDPNDPPGLPASRLESLVMAETEAISGASMSAAFTTSDRAKGDLKFANAIKGKSDEQVAAIKAERKGEQTALQLWIQLPDEKRRQAFKDDRLELGEKEMPKPITAALVDGNAVKIKSLIGHRCGTCHSKGEEKEDVPLTEYDEIAKHLKVEQVGVVNGYIKVEEPISLTKLTQSTHAHLLSFAVLFSLTGVIFAFSSYATGIRCILGPWVVIAVFADVSLWWLARLSDAWGPYFAQGIILTGGVAGAGLFGQIVLSLFNMYGKWGKAVIAMFFAVGAGILVAVWINKIEPELKNPKPQVPAKKVEPAKKEEPPKKDNGTNKDNGKKELYKPVNGLDQLLTLPRLDDKDKPIAVADLQFNGSDKGSMVPAFFDKDKTYKKMMGEADVPQAEKDRLKAAREGDLAALVAWVRGDDKMRKAAYDSDTFEVPAELVGKVTPDLVQAGKVKIKSLIDARCATCHSPEGKQDSYPLTNYEEIAKYLQPLATAKAQVPEPAPAPGKVVTPIPAAKDD